MSLPLFAETVPPLTEAIGFQVSNGTSAWHCHGYRQFWRYVWNADLKRWECGGCKEPMFHA